MTLTEYFAAHPNRGERERVRDAAGVSYETLRRVLRGGRVRDLRVARRISGATGGQVPVWQLLGLAETDIAQPRRRKQA